MRSYKEKDLWGNITDGEWYDWKWQLKNRITSWEMLAKVIDLSTKEAQEIDCCLKKFRMAITPYYASLIDKSDPLCPIRMQCVPSINELCFADYELNDPLGEESSSPVDNIVHRYPDRVLFLLTRKCAMYCRHCTRRRVVGEEEFSINKVKLEKGINYIRDNPQIRDVLLSGGDPFILSDNYLEYIISRLREIPSVEIIRIGTRTPVVLPMRITDNLLIMLKKYQPIWINTHFNHPKELTDLSIKACEKIVDSGIPLGNQSVLLAGINDNTEILKELFLKLVKVRVRPYYLYQCDIATGIGHFRTPIEKGIEIMKNLRGNISGFAIPTFVIDAPMGGGKIPINPDYIVRQNESQVVLRNYKDDIYVYPNIPVTPFMKAE